MAVSLSSHLPARKEAMQVAAAAAAALLAFSFCCLTVEAAPTTRFYSFTIQSRNVTRNCATVFVPTVNRRYPGPTIYANEGDRVIVNVTNISPYNITLHMHGIRQLFSCWADGPAYVTQCPIQPGNGYVYNFTVTNQTGTIFWHSHYRWLRATVHGAIVIYPRSGEPYPFTFPKAEHIVILGEWWNAQIEDIENQALINGGGSQIADAYTLNGLPGPLYNCSANDVYRIQVQQGNTYLLRLINAALNTELYFAVANHNLTVVETDGDYAKPYTTTSVFIAPGQSLGVLLSTNQPVGRYYMGVSPYSSANGVPFRMTPALGIVEYSGDASSRPVMPTFPGVNNTAYVTNFNRNLRCLGGPQHPEPVPKTTTSNFLVTVGLGTRPCDENQFCQGPNGTKLTAAMNNISFVLPSISVLQAYYFNISGVFTRDFPAFPLTVYDYTGNTLRNLTPLRGTRTAVIPYNASVQIILQGTGLVGPENHPIHLHGYSFYIVGEGFGNFNSSDVANFNLVDPPRRNTVGVPVGGWSAIRFWADNPGVWYMHCHLEIHTVWGLATTFTVLNGPGNKILPPPPADLPPC